MKKILSITFILVFFWGSIQKNLLPVFGADNQSPGTLYSESAVLMDADSGRILYEKNGYEQRPMASTTKIMTCILALENGKEEDIVTASEYAASRPKVHLGVRKGEQFRFGDLLYSLMLESHNDTAVMLAEHLEGDVETFADKMNQKAKKIGCRHTFFITPNGLDATKKTGENEQVHSTTAADLARIMRYCIKESPQKEAFLNITRTQSYTFWDIEKKRSFSCNNHNAFLSMMEGALSGKTGFTAKAGYCYVGALKREEKTLIVALLACGWPNNKTYKWKDTVKLMECHFKQIDGIQAELTILVNGEKKVYHGQGNGRLDAISNAIMKHFDIKFSLVTYEEHALQVGSDSQACAYVGLEVEGVNGIIWGAGIKSDIIDASASALISALNRSNHMNK